MLVSVIIPVWNLWKLTLACLESLAATTPADALEVIVIDNGSADETAANLDAVGRKLFGANFHSKHLPENLGFAKACNIGAKMASNELLFFLNNDTTATAKWLDPLLSSFAKPLGAIGPLLLYPDGKLQHCGIAFTPFFEVEHLYHDFPGSHRLVRVKRPLQAITGAAFMTRKSLFSRLGGFCEDYLNGCEDIDLCFRMTRAGYKLDVASGSVFYHHASQTAGRFDRDVANSGILRSRWGDYYYPDMHLHAARDGYNIHIGQNLEISLEITPEREHKILFAAMKKKKPLSNADIEELLAEEPLWRNGWTMLIQALLNAGQVEAAGKYSMEAVKLAANPGLLNSLNTIWNKYDPSQPPIFDLKDCGFIPSKEDMKNNMRTTAAALARAQSRRDSMLAHLLKNWLEKYGKIN